MIRSSVNHLFIGLLPTLCLATSIPRLQKSGFTTRKSLFKSKKNTRQEPVEKPVWAQPHCKKTLHQFNAVATIFFGPVE